MNIIWSMWTRAISSFISEYVFPLGQVSSFNWRRETCCQVPVAQQPFIMCPDGQMASVKAQGRLCGGDKQGAGLLIQPHCRQILVSHCQSKLKQQRNDFLDSRWQISYQHHFSYGQPTTIVCLLCKCNRNHIMMIFKINSPVIRLIGII